MNLQSSKARIPIAALGVTALVCGAGALTSPAFAATLAVNPTATSVTVLNLGAQATAGSGTGYNLVQPLSDAAYALHVNGTSLTSLKLSIDSYTAPTGVSSPGTPYVYYAEKTTGGSAGPTFNGTTGPYARVNASTTPVLTNALTVTSGAAPNDIFIAATATGTYTMHFVDGGTQAGTDDDSVSSTITLTVKDSGGVTTETVDDLAPTVSNSASSVGIGAPVAGSVDLGTLARTDARGSSAGAGVLGAKINALVGIKFTGVAGLAGGDTTSTAGTFGTSQTSRSIPVGRTTAAGTLTTTAAFDTNGDGTLTDFTLGTATTTVASNNVTATTDPVATDVVGSVKQTGTAVAVKTGTPVVTYKATVTDTDTDKSGNVVYWTLAGADVAGLTTNGTTVDSANHIFSTLTDSSGVASLSVTSSATAAGKTYTIDASSNGTAVAGVVTVTYADPAAGSFVADNTDAELTPTAGAGVTVTLKGKLLDQFGAAFTPAVSGQQTVTVTSPAGVTTICNAVITNGAFSCAYSPSTTPVAGTSTTYRFAYPSVTSYNGTINYASSTAASSLVLATPVDAATGVNLTTSATLAPGQATGAGTFGSSTGQVSGTVYDSNGGTLAYKSVTLSGGTGVYFSSAASPGTSTSDDLTPTLTVVTNGSGVFTGYAFFTKVGTVKITATSGSATDDATVTTDDSADSYTITVDDATGTPGSTLIVTGTIKDAFGNPVPNVNAELSIGTSTLGAFGDNTPTTNAAGVFSTTFVSGSNQSGTADLTATIAGQSANRTPAAALLTNGGLTVATGDYQDTAEIKLTAVVLTLTATAQVSGATKTTVSGTFSPNTGVDIYARASGAESYSLYDSVTTDDDGKYSKTYALKKTTNFLAKSGGLSSQVDTTQVFSTVSLTAKSTSKGEATLTALGSPSAVGSITFYRSVAGDDIKLKTVTSNSLGDARVTVSLPKGSRSVYATYKAPGTGLGTSETIKVTVK